MRSLTVPILVLCPKSITFTIPAMSRRMLLGLMSQWTKPSECMALRPSAAWMKVFTASSKLEGGRTSRDLPSMTYRVSIDNLEPGLTYYYQVEFTDANGASEGGDSEVRQFTMPRRQ